MDEIKVIRIVSLTGEKEYGIEDSEVREELANVVDGAPEELDSFKEAFEKFKEGGEVLAGINTAVEANAKAIKDEAKRAVAAEKVLEADITAETARATTRENELESGYGAAVAAEIARAQAAEAALNGKVTAAAEAQAAALTQEVQRAQAAEKANADAIAAEKTRAEAAETKAKEDAVTLALRQLYIAAGAVYNESTGQYAISGVDDLSEEEMLHIYSYKDIASSFALGRIPGRNFKGRVILPLRNNTGTGQIYTNNFPISGTGAFTGTNIEVFKISTTQELFETNIVQIPYLSNNAYEMFTNCTKLITVYPLNIQKVTTTAVLREIFKNNQALVDLCLYGAKVDLHIGDSPLLSKDSVLYIINNAAPTSAITITLHADAYARLKDNADIVAALAAQPLVTLVSA